MAETVIDIAQTFQALYGYLPAHVPALPAAPDAGNPYSVSTAPSKKTVTATGAPLYGLADMLGREVFMPFTLIIGQLKFDFPFAIVGLKNRKILKATPMVERGGEVIEEIAVGAWEMEVKGFMIDPNDQFPDDQLTLLYQAYKHQGQVGLQCALTSIFIPNGESVVISSLDIPAKAKVIGVREFAFTMIEDSILDLYKVS